MNKAPYSFSKGFTIIELLVVIAIIGVLASIILVADHSARLKSQDVSILSYLEQSRSAFAIGDIGGLYTGLYNPNPSSLNLTNVPGSLTTNGPSYSDLNLLAQSAITAGGLVNYAVDTNTTIGNATTPNATAYAIYGELASDPTKYFCLDSTGKDNLSSATHATTACP